MLCVLNRPLTLLQPLVYSLISLAHTNIFLSVIVVKIFTHLIANADVCMLLYEQLNYGHLAPFRCQVECSKAILHGKIWHHSHLSAVVLHACTISTCVLCMLYTGKKTMVTIPWPSGWHLYEPQSTPERHQDVHCKMLPSVESCHPVIPLEVQSWHTFTIHVRVRKTVFYQV